MIEGFEHIMDNVIDEFVHVAGDVAQTAEFNPVTCYDKYWNMYFNYDTRGYYLRQSYRSTIEYELKRAFGLIEIYRNIFAPMTKDPYNHYNEMFVAAGECLYERMNPTVFLVDGGDAIQGTIMTDDIANKEPDSEHPVIAANLR